MDKQPGDIGSLRSALAHGRALHKTAAYRVQVIEGRTVVEVLEADASCTPYEFWWRPARPEDEIPQDEWELREEGEWMGCDDRLDNGP